MKSCFHRLSAVLLLSGAVASTYAAPIELPANLVKYERPAFPAELKATSTLDGYATVAFIVRADGAVEDVVVLEASHVAFGKSVLDVLPAWRFAPATSAALPRREVLRFEFEEKGVVTSLSHREATKAAFPLTAQERMPIRTVTAKQLQTPPQRLSAGPPFKASGSGSVAVSYIIDTDGRVRVPVVLSTTRPELGIAALAAVKQWQFAPPMYEGMPVLVEDMRSFTVGK